MSGVVPPLRRHNVMVRMRTTLFLPFILFHGDACEKSQFCGGMVLTGEIAVSWREANRNATFFYPTCRGIAWGCDWCGLPGRQSPRDGKMSSRISFLNCFLC